MMQKPEAIVNGGLEDQISSFDRGVAYGDGVFETIAVRRGETLYWEDHLERLQHGCSVLGLQGLEASLLEREVQQLINHKESCVIKIIITRGVGGRGYQPGKQALTRIVQKYPWPEIPAAFRQNGIEVTQCTFRISRQPKLSQIKHLNRLEQVLARAEWEDEFQDGLVCDMFENIIEATSSNVFFESNGALITPDLTHCGVAGIMRKKVIEYCLSNDIQIQVRDFKLAEIPAIQGMMLCNSIAGILPVRRYCERELDKSAITERIASALNCWGDAG